ncbi:hypothetical protein VCHA53O466_10164 [Vibrio chagasii]|nr:hypothetical protein VCHA53O466_10164 [Vibrio chagasii]
MKSMNYFEVVSIKLTSSLNVVVIFAPHYLPVVAAMPFA